mmetsp:Transcript_50555/g.152331  ORF Transcript_50555/g.152331 Transcript_50555/m.152331 type:complete len:120 (-) Transcript_50555:872-1231(-)
MLTCGQSGAWAQKNQMMHPFWVIMCSHGGLSGHVDQILYSTSIHLCERLLFQMAIHARRHGSSPMNTNGNLCVCDRRSNDQVATVALSNVLPHNNSLTSLPRRQNTAKSERQSGTGKTI